MSVAKGLFFPLGVTIALAIGILVLSCNTGIEVSPAPGVIRVTLQSDPADTSIIIIKDTIAVSERDWFGVTITQGKIYHGDNFAILFKDTKSYRVEDVIYNILEREAGQYKKFTIYESYAPPNSYDKLQFGVTASLLRMGFFNIPVQLRPGDALLVDQMVNFDIKENQTTEINVQISPFKSVVRYKDTYYFTRQMQIIDVRYY